MASARAIRQAQRGADYGFDVTGLRVDMARVKARKDAIVMQSRSNIEAGNGPGVISRISRWRAARAADRRKRRHDRIGGRDQFATACANGGGFMATKR